MKLRLSSGDQDFVTPKGCPMALVLVCVAGVSIGFAFDLAVLIYAMAFAGPAAFLVCAGNGIGHALLIAGGILIALQVGFAVGLASRWLAAPRT
jgi:hypothetical protein